MQDTSTVLKVSLKNHKNSFPTNKLSNNILIKIIFLSKNFKVYPESLIKENKNVQSRVNACHFIT